MVHSDILYKVNPLCLRLRRNQLPYSIQHFIDIKIARLQLHLTAFNFGHIQNIVNQPQQVFRRGLYFLQTVYCPLFALVLLQCNCRHTDNTVHRCAYLVAHSG